MAECHAEGKKHLAGTIDVYVGGFNNNMYSSNGANGNVDFYQSSTRNNAVDYSTLSASREVLRKETDSDRTALHFGSLRDDRIKVVALTTVDTGFGSTDGGKIRGADRPGSKCANQTGGLYIGMGKVGGSTNGQDPKTGANGGSSPILNGSTHKKEDFDNGTVKLGSSCNGEISKRATKATSETVLQVGPSNGHLTAPKTTKVAEAHALSSSGGASAPRGSPNGGSPTVGSLKVGGGGLGEAASSSGSSNGGSPTAEGSKGVKAPSVSNILGNGGSPTSGSVRGIGNIVGVGGSGLIGNLKPPSARAVPSDGQGPNSTTARGTSTPRNSGEYSTTGNGNLRSGSTSTPKNSGELSTTGNGNLRGGSASRISSEGNLNGRIITGSNPGDVAKGTRSTTVSPTRSNSASPGISNVGNLRKGNWNGGNLSNGVASKGSGKADCANGNILNVGNLSHGLAGANGNVLNTGIISNGLGSKGNGKGEPPKNGADTLGMANTDFLSEAALMKRALCSTDPEEVKNVGNELYKKGHFSEALALYDRAIALSPSHAPYHSNRAAALTGLGRLAEAVQECEEAIKLDPFYVRAHQRAASLYLRLGLVESSKRHLRAGGQQSDLGDFQRVQKVEKHISRCIETRKAQDWKGVIRESDAAVVAGAESAPQIFGYKAEALLRLHRPEEANVILTAAQRVEESLTKPGVTPADSLLYIVRAQIDMALGRFEGAIMAAESAARIDPRNAEVSTLLRKARAVGCARTSGNELFKAGKFFEACASYGEGLESDPLNAVLLCNRAACRSKLGQWEKAVEDCNAALNVQPNYTKALMRRANCNAKLERWEDALCDYEALLREVPGDMEVARGLFDVQVAIKKSRGEEIYKMKFGGEVEQVSNNDEYREAVTFPGLVVVQFITSWNDQCKQISPFINELCKRHPSVNFIKVDVEDNPYLAKTESVRFVPTFKIYKNGMKVKEILGPSQQELEFAVKHYSL